MSESNTRKVGLQPEIIGLKKIKTFLKVIQENIFEDIGIEDNNDQGGDNNEDNEQKNHLLV